MSAPSDLGWTWADVCDGAAEYLFILPPKDSVRIFCLVIRSCLGICPPFLKTCNRVLQCFQHCGG